MTAQIRDTIIYNSQKYSLATEPLRPYLEAKGIEYPGTSTGNYRGYIASWEVIDNKLYLTHIKIPGFLPELDSEANLFPGEVKTFADWYTGQIRIPHGELLEYVHQGYGSLYDKELYLRFLHGILQGESEKDNRPEYKERIARQKRYEREQENKKILNRFRRFLRI
ncbi:MAG: hypothetical protein LAT80_13495 [Balneolaceae bacterium]|nr:hypothetical protein [Balneolaceae bacterium]